ncbi:MAG: creatininase family protein [Alphaproteobacteria bacterium]|nr:creatininase family protein [Alphaproteobacteria bacterium]
MQIAILPLGAFEQHANHLPLETDSIIVEGLINTLKQLIDTNNKILFLPVETIGYSPEHLFDERSKSLTYVEAIEKFFNAAAYCVKNHNIKKIIILNAHGGNSAIMNIVATELRYKLKILCVCTSWSRFKLPAGLITENERALDIHGGFIETSLMLHFAPNLVNMEKAENFNNKQQDFIKKFKYLRAYGTHYFGWLTPDLNSKGACGNAAKAKAKAGAIIANHICTELIELINDVNNFDLNDLKQ